MPRKKKAAEEVAVDPEVVEEGQGKEDAPQKQTTALALRGESAVDVHPEVVRRKMAAIRSFQEIVRNELVEGQDYGVIPGTPKPTLLKPGAEKIIKLLDLADIVTIEDKIEEWKEGFFYYRVKCELVSLLTGQTVATGIGSCNSKEDKYRWRWIAEFLLTEDQKRVVEETHPPFKQRQGRQGMFYVYRFENEEIFTQVNTLLKMAKKRAQVDAALSVGRLSNLFTQDIEDTGVEDSSSFFSQSPNTKKETAPKRKPAAPKPAPEPKPESEDPLDDAVHKQDMKGAKDTHPMISLTLSNGAKVNVTQFQALDYFKAIKDSLNKASGDDAMYYATLEQFGYKHSKDVPIEKISGIWDTMVEVWKMYKNKVAKK